MGTEKIAWDAAAFSELAARVKDVESILATWTPLIEPILLIRAAGDHAVRDRIHNLGLHVKQHEGENERLRLRIAELERANCDLQASNDRMLEQIRGTAAAFEKMLG